MLPRRLLWDSLLEDLESDKADKFMKCDIYEEDNVYYVVADVPGYNKEDINIEYENGNIRIIASQTETDNENKKYMRRERIYSSSCERSFYLGEDIIEDEIKAEFKDGILTVSIPKSNKDEKTKKIISID